MTGIEIAKMILDITLAVGSFLIEAFKSGDASALDRPLSEIMPHELRTTAAKALADEAAKRKFEVTP